MQKVIIIGCPGAGKSTFARWLRNQTGLPLHYLDMLWHKPDKTNITREEFDVALEGIMKKDQWIIDGNYGRTLEMRLSECDTVFLLDLPVEVCLSGAMARIGKKREDMPWVEAQMDEEFREWILKFSEIELPHIYAMLDKYKDKHIVIFKSREEIDRYRESWEES